MRPYLHLFRQPALVTFTVDPKRFEGPAEARKYVEGQGFIRRFLRLVGFDPAIKVLGFQENGWPHWHLVVDFADVGGFVSFQRFWSLWRDRWGVGGVDVSVKHRGLTAEQAIGYAVNYAQSQGKNGVPSWVRSMRRAPRSFEVYGKLRKAVSAVAAVADEPDAVEEVADEPDAVEQAAQEKEKRHPKRTIGERLDECGSGAAVVREVVYPDGRKFYRYVGELSVSPVQLLILWRQGKLGGRFSSVMVESESVQGEGGYRGVRVGVPCGGDDAGDVLDRLRRAVVRAAGDRMGAESAWPDGLAEPSEAFDSDLTPERPPDDGIPI